MSVFDLSRHQTHRHRVAIEETIAGFSLLSVLGLAIVGLLMVLPLLNW